MVMVGGCGDDRVTVTVIICCYYFSRKMKTIKIDEIDSISKHTRDDEGDAMTSLRVSE